MFALRQSAVAPWQLWHDARLNLAERDSLRLASATQPFEDPGAASVAQARNELRASILRGGLLPATAKLRRGGWEETVDTLFPERSGAAWHVVGNPPYAPLGPRTDLQFLRERFTALTGTTPTGSTNAFIPFTEIMWALSRGQGSAAYIVPLSIAYNTGSVFRSLRKAVSVAGGRWTFRFFDRTPDSLFGDDVKQRVAIITREPAGEFVVRTSGLMRWTSAQRHKLFADLPAPVKVPNASIVSGIPKIGSLWELSTYEAVRSRADRLSESLIPAESADEMSLAVGATAYNQLTLYRDGVHEPNGVDVNVYATASPDQADWAFAILSVFLALLARGGGRRRFHVPARWP